MRFISLTILVFLSVCQTGVAATIVSGTQSTTAGTPAQLSQTSQFCQEVVVSANENNTDVVVVGDKNVDATDVTRTGLQLLPGQVEYIRANRTINLVNLYMDTIVNDEDISFLCINN